MNDQLIAAIPVLAGVLVGGALTWGQQIVTARRQSTERRQAVYARFHAAGRRYSDFLVAEEVQTRVVPADDRPDGHVVTSIAAQEYLGRLADAYAEVMLATANKLVTDAAFDYRASLRALHRSRAHHGAGKIPEQVVGDVRRAADGFLAAARRDLGYPQAAFGEAHTGR